MNKKNIFVLGALAAFMLIVIWGGITLTRNLGKSDKVITAENANEELENYYKKITVNNVTPRKESVTLTDNSLENTLPDISKYKPSVDNTTDDYIEIFSSTEKTGEKKDGWLNDVAKDFNNANMQVNGKTVSVRIRGLASGTGMDYITSGKYVPDAYTPSNELWGELAKSKGVDIKLADKKLLGNVSGVLLSKSKNTELMQKYGSINLKTIVDSTVNNEIQMGYTNPLSSATGLNFLVSTLNTFDSSNPLSENAVSNFEKFQGNIPLVAYTTLQMRDSAQSGTLDGMVMEYQTYINSPDLKADYIFTPFGYRHDSPLYKVGDLSAEKEAILSKFIDFCGTDKYQKLANEDGFNQNNDYKSEMADMNGDTIAQALKIWKDKKNSNKKICAVFDADISGSMEGQPLNRLKESLLNSSQYISKDVSIGVVSYSDDVNINLPIGKFDLNQRSLFTGAVKDLKAGGGTATLDSVLVATKMLIAEKEKDPDAKLMLFVLSDGNANRGLSLKEVKGILEAYKIPVYTIGYNANIQALQNLSQINEAASIDADSEDVVYTLSNLFNAEM